MSKYISSIQLTKFFLLLFKVVPFVLVIATPALAVFVFVFVLYPSEFTDRQESESGKQRKACSYELVENGENAIEAGIDYLVRTPLDYRKEQAWPLVLVFSPAISGRFMESYTGLTSTLTKIGFVVAYVDPVKMNLKNINQLEKVYKDISSRWCIDDQNVFLSGHSDGATISQALVFLPEVETRFSGFISSAAGINEEHLGEYECSYPANAFVLHNTGDKHFRDYGSAAARWWAECNHCESEQVLPGGCIVFSECLEGVEVRFCEQNGGHLKWPERHAEIREFLERARK